jgi:3-phosphoshikimate 1-carboxyvinyltransferase
VLACFIEGESVIRGAEELKVKESNRIDTTVNALKAMGADITATDDGMIIRGKGYLKGGVTIDPMGDHRIAMAMSVAGALSQEGVNILNPECVAISYPNFFELFKE